MKVLSALAATTLLLLGSAHAGRNSSGKRNGKRPMTNVVKRHGFKLTSREEFTDVSGYTDLKMEFTTNGFPRWRMRYDAELDGDRINSKFRVGLVSVVEYNSTISVQDSESRYKLTGNGRGKGNGQRHHWTQLTAPEDVATDPSGEYSTSLVSDDDDIALGITVSTFLSSEERWSDAANATVKDNGCKFGVEISNYPYAYQNSSLAIVAVVQTKGADKIKQKHGEEAVEVDDDLVGPEEESRRLRVLEEEAPVADKLQMGDLGENEFAWATTFINEHGEEMEVVGGMVNVALPDYGSDDEGDDDKDGDEASKFVVFKFESAGSQPSTIIWDPELAVNEDKVLGSESNGASALGFSAFTSLVGVFCALAMMM